MFILKFVSAADMMTAIFELHILMQSIEWQLVSTLDHLNVKELQLCDL